MYYSSFFCPMHQLHFQGWGANPRFFILCINSNRFHIAFLLLFFQPTKKVMHKQLSCAFLHQILPLPSAIILLTSFISSESYGLIDAGTSFFSVPASIFRFVPAARIRPGPRLDEKRCTKGFHDLRASLLIITLFHYLHYSARSFRWIFRNSKITAADRSALVRSNRS